MECATVFWRDSEKIKNIKNYSDQEIVESCDHKRPGRTRHVEEEEDCFCRFDKLISNPYFREIEVIIDLV